MTLDEHYKAYVAACIVEDLPEPFWRRIADGTKHTYADSFSETQVDSQLVEEQRLNALLQRRYFRMEHMLVTTAAAAGVPASPKLIGDNNCHYGFAAKGRVGVTQSYVANVGEMPRPANFRQQLAQASDFKRQSRLDLGDEPAELITPKQVMGILLHSPTGRRFVADDQKLGEIGFYVPYDDFKGWAAHLSLSEILGLYAPVEKRDDRAAPVRKPQKKTGTDE